MERRRRRTNGSAQGLAESPQCVTAIGWPAEGCLKRCGYEALEVLDEPCQREADVRRRRQHPEDDRDHEPVRNRQQSSKQVRSDIDNDWPDCERDYDVKGCDPDPRRRCPRKPDHESLGRDLHTCGFGKTISTL